MARTPYSVMIIWSLLFVARTSVAESKKVAILPFASVGASTDICQAVREQLGVMLKKRFDVTIVNQVTSDRIAQQTCVNSPGLWECLGANKTLLTVGQQLKVDLVVSAKLVMVGNRLALQARIAQVQLGRISTESLKASQTQRSSIINKLFLINNYGLSTRATTPKTHPNYAELVSDSDGSWIIWTAVGLGAAIAAGVVIYVVADPLGNAAGNNHWDDQLSLPPYR